MQKYNDKELSEILDKLSDESKNCLIRALIQNDKKNVSIVTEPIYKNITDANGDFVGKIFVEEKYGVQVIYKGEEYREYDFIYEISYVDNNYLYHIIEAHKDNFEETIYKIFANGGFEVEIACTYIDKEKE